MNLKVFIHDKDGGLNKKNDEGFVFGFNCGNDKKKVGGRLARRGKENLNFWL